MLYYIHTFRQRIPKGRSSAATAEKHPNMFAGRAFLARPVKIPTFFFREARLIIAVAFLLAMIACTVASAEGEEAGSNLYGTFWSLLPPIIAIGLALITKEVYTSLFVGIVVGCVLQNITPNGFSLEHSVTGIFEMMTAKLGDGWNVGILIFLVILGILSASGLRTKSRPVRARSLQRLRLAA